MAQASPPSSSNPSRMGRRSGRLLPRLVSCKGAGSAEQLLSVMQMTHDLLCQGKESERKPEKNVLGNIRVVFCRVTFAFQIPLLSRVLDPNKAHKAPAKCIQRLE